MRYGLRAFLLAIVGLTLASGCSRHRSASSAATPEADPVLKPSPTGEAPEIRSRVFPYAYEAFHLANGLQVVLVPTGEGRLAYMELLVRAGARTETDPGKTGFAHLFEHLMFRSASPEDDARQLELFKRLGASRSAYTSDDFTGYETTVPVTHLHTVLREEAERFITVQHDEAAFRTETRAVLGEYDKNSANPLGKLLEEVRDLAFVRHPYAHTAMGYLADIQRMPERFAYAADFRDRFYRPEHSTLLVVGNFDIDRIRDAVVREWSPWPRGRHEIRVPVEPEQTSPRTRVVPWPQPTSPWLTIAFRGPAFSPHDAAMPAVDLLMYSLFSQHSELYDRLVHRERKVDMLIHSQSDHRDPYLVKIFARLHDIADLPEVRQAILDACEGAKSEAVDPSTLADIRAHFHYGYAARLQSSQGIGQALRNYLGLTRDPEAPNLVFRAYAGVRSEDLRATARTIFRNEASNTVVLAHGPVPELAPMQGRRSNSQTTSSQRTPKSVTATIPLHERATQTTPLPARAGMVLQPSRSPLVSLEVVFPTGSADAPPPAKRASHSSRPVPWPKVPASGATRASFVNFCSPWPRTSDTASTRR